MNKKLMLKRILTIIGIPVIGFILLNLTFLLDFLFQSLVDKLFPVNYNMTSQWFPISKHILFVAIIIVISWFILKSRLKELYKAIFITVPTAVILVTAGMFLYQWPGGCIRRRHIGLRDYYLLLVQSEKTMVFLLCCHIGGFGIVDCRYFRGGNIGQMIVPPPMHSSPA